MTTFLRLHHVIEVSDDFINGVNTSVRTEKQGEGEVDTNEKWDWRLKWHKNREKWGGGFKKEEPEQKRQKSAATFEDRKSDSDIDLRGTRGRIDGRMREGG